VDPHNHPHEHTHGIIDPSILATKKGIWAVKWSFVALLATTLIQAFVVYISGSVALLGDTVHNLGDAFTAIPIGFAFIFGQKKPTKRFTYGYGRLEDIAGVLVVLAILISGLFAGYASLQRFFNPQEVEYLGTIVFASIIGFIGNEAVAIFRIKVGKEMGSAALIADGYHARTDGLVSLGVLLSVLGVWLGYPLADPIIGLIMTLMIFKIVWESSITVFTRMLDGVDPDLVDKIKGEAVKINGVEEVNEIRVRWIGHYLHAEMNVTVDHELTVEEGHNIAKEVRHSLLHHVQFLSHAVIHVDPSNASGEVFHEN
jgi:cation diffusion facilitator family transporter